MAENTTPQGSNNAGVVIGWIEKLSNLIQKTGLQNIALTIMVLFLVIVVGYVAFNPEVIVKKVEEIQNQAHTEAVKSRLDAEPVIRENVVELRSELGADRAFVLETHNGGSNLANLPFLYVDLTYAEPRSDMSWLETDYKNVRLSRYPWASEVYSDTFWIGPISDIESTDPELYLRLQKEDVEYIGVVVMYGTYNPSGVLGVTYKSAENIPTESEIKKQLTRYSSAISQLLNHEQ